MNDYSKFLIQLTKSMRLKMCSFFFCFIRKLRPDLSLYLFLRLNTEWQEKTILWYLASVEKTSDE